MKKTHSLNDLTRLAGLIEARDYDVTPGQTLMIVGGKYMDLIDNLEFASKKLKKTGNKESAKSIDNIIGAMQHGIDSLDAAKADLGK